MLQEGQRSKGKEMNSEIDLIDLNTLAESDGTGLFALGNKNKSSLCFSQVIYRSQSRGQHITLKQISIMLSQI